MHENASSRIYKESLKSVCEIKATFDAGGEENDYGSAVMVSDNLFVTNAHVIAHKKGEVLDEANSCFLRFGFEEEYHSASILRYDYDIDIALITIEEKIKSTKPITFATKNINGGDICYAVGNGLNHGIGISSGIISNPLVEINSGTTRKVIQCDLTINSGNSGGALLDSDGHLIGITTFRLKDNYGNVIHGTSYSVPCSEFKHML